MKISFLLHIWLIKPSVVSYDSMLVRIIKTVLLHYDSILSKLINEFEMKHESQKVVIKFKTNLIQVYNCNFEQGMNYCYYPCSRVA